MTEMDGAQQQTHVACSAAATVCNLIYRASAPECGARISGAHILEAHLPLCFQQFIFMICAPANEPTNMALLQLRVGGAPTTHPAELSTGLRQTGRQPVCISNVADPLQQVGVVCGW